MNPRLQQLQPYPFERLKALHAGIAPNPNLRPISMGMGEPKHAAPALVEDAIKNSLSGLSNYPATAGEPKLRQAFAAWIEKRYGLKVDALTQTLPVNGSREALFALVQTVVTSSAIEKIASKQGGTPATYQKDAESVQKHDLEHLATPLILSPNPFYQIYEGAALLAGADVHYVPSVPEKNFAVDWAGVAPEVWARTQLIFVCSPGNPTGAVMPLDEWRLLFELSDRHGFVIASDECYSEIYFRDEPPLGSLQAAQALGRSDFKNLVAFTSLSKRSNVPGMRSGFVAGDAAIMKAFLLYRTYHGSAMSPVVQAASIAAWGDEAHVEANRAMYREKFAQVTPMLQQVLDVQLSDAGFYLWARVPQHICGGSDERFSQELLQQQAVTVLPGSYLARADAAGHNPGAGRVRMALVAEVSECVQAAQRIVEFCRQASHA
jgi:N-succinyldiaminopimelate aminotransferase